MLASCKASSWVRAENRLICTELLSFTKLIGETLANKIVQVSGPPSYNTPPVHLLCVHRPSERHFSAIYCIAKKILN